MQSYFLVIVHGTMLTSSKKIVTFGIVGTMTLVLLLGTIGTNFVFVQTAYGIGDPNERSATQFAPGIVKDLQP